MLTKDKLNQLLPDDIATWDFAEALTGLDLGSPNAVERGLMWLAEQTEANRFPPSGHWQTEAGGLSYKSNGSYLTAEGWPMGTTCWYVRIECGWREYAAAESIRLALVRGLIVFGLAVKNSEYDGRENIADVIADEMAAFAKSRA